MNSFRKRDSGFTLIELLVVIALIGLLSSFMLAVLNDARKQGKVTKARLDLHELNSAIALLAFDTSKWPNGCPVGMWEDPEVNMDDPWAGIKYQPPVGTPPVEEGATRHLCKWTVTDVNNWKGPYYEATVDPWGHSYIFDPDYCDESGHKVVALDSKGSDGLESYKSDNCNVAIEGGGPTPGDDIVLYPGTDE